MKKDFYVKPSMMEVKVMKESALIVCSGNDEESVGTGGTAIPE